VKHLYSGFDHLAKHLSRCAPITKETPVSTFRAPIDDVCAAGYAVLLNRVDDLNTIAPNDCYVVRGTDLRALYDAVIAIRSPVRELTRLLARPGDPPGW
jgi:hypothetical protein